MNILDIVYDSNHQSKTDGIFIFKKEQNLSPMAISLLNRMIREWGRHIPSAAVHERMYWWIVDQDKHSRNENNALYFKSMFLEHIGERVPELTDRLKLIQEQQLDIYHLLRGKRENSLLRNYSQNVVDIAPFSRLVFCTVPDYEAGYVVVTDEGEFEVDCYAVALDLEWDLDDESPARCTIERMLPFDSNVGIEFLFSTMKIKTFEDAETELWFPFYPSELYIAADASSVSAAYDFEDQQIFSRYHHIGSIELPQMKRELHIYACNRLTSRHSDIGIPDISAEPEFGHGW